MAATGEVGDGTRADFRTGHDYTGGTESHCGGGSRNHDAGSLFKDGKQLYDTLALGKTFDWIKVQVGGGKAADVKK